MGRYWLSALIVLLFLSQDRCPSLAAAASPGADVPRENPLSILFRQDPPAEFTDHLEARMTTVSVIMALLAVGVAVPTLVWCKRLQERVTRLNASLPGIDAVERLAEVAQESKALQARVEHLRQSGQADTTRFESAIRQLENRIAALEQRYNGFDTVSKDLDSLRDFRGQVERIHARIAKAFNGALSGASSAALQDEESPHVDV